MIRKLLIWGKGGHGAVVEEAAMLTGQFTNIEFIDDKDLLDNWTTRYSMKEWRIHIAIGNNQDREKVFKRIDELGYHHAVIVHPRAFVSPKATLGRGCFIGPLTSVQTRSFLGDGVVINTNASIDHDCKIGNFVHIAPGTNLCGSVEVGDRTLLAVGSRVVPKIKIGKDCIVGAGSAIVSQIDGNGLRIWGVPAKVV
jgi:UDP-N-acetylbacillosamine N-acetyltransferase